MISEEALLFIEPAGPATPAPVIDHITRRMCAAYRQARPSDWAAGGYHRCICGAMSDDHDSHLPNGDRINSLCVHYVAHHRAEVPPGQLARVEALALGEAEPTWRELHGPHPILPDLPADLRQALDDLDAQIDALHQDVASAIADHDWERAVRLRAESRDRTRPI